MRLAGFVWWALALICLITGPGVIAQNAAEAPSRLPLIHLTIPEVKFQRLGLERAAQQLQDAANAIKKGGRPIEIVVQHYSTRRNPEVTAHIRGQSLDTLLDFITEQVGYTWTINKGKIVIYSNSGLQKRDQLVRAIPGRLRMKGTIIPELIFEQTPLSEALDRLEKAARNRGLGRLEPSGGAFGIENRVRVRGEELLVSGHFVNTDVDTILEILTKQTRVLDWSVEKGQVIIIQKGQEATATSISKRGAGAPDPFAAPAAGDPFAAPARSRASAGYGPTTISRPTAPVGGRPSDDEAGLQAESYQHLRDNPFLSPWKEPISTFSIDVDTASYANIRRFIMQMDSVPPPDAVRIEEMINYFDYNYPLPRKVVNPQRPDLPVEHPFAAHAEVAGAPWKSGHRLVKIGLQGYEIPLEERPPSNLVFLLDVSGSMRAPNKLPLVQQSMQLLLSGLTEQDRVAIVVYAGASGLVLESTPGTEIGKIRDAIDRLEAGGSTNAGQGIQLAYQVAEDNFVPTGNNRVILCTDGDFNVGVTDKAALQKIVEEKAAKGVQLTVLGFGIGNLKDDMLETLSNYGDGNYGYIDSYRESQKLFSRQLLGTLFMIAKDVKIQVAFNPRKVAAYRLIGYENRLLDKEDFDNDEIDAGDIGSGHTVTALYEIVPPGVPLPVQPGNIDLRYEEPGPPPSGTPGGNALLTLKLRYKWPNEETSRLLEAPITDPGTPFAAASPDMQFAAAVAGFGMLLRQSPHISGFSHDQAHDIAKAHLGKDEHGERQEFLKMLSGFIW